MTSPQEHPDPAPPVVITLTARITLDGPAVAKVVQTQTLRRGRRKD